MIDYKDLLIKYIKHIQFEEGIDYLSEGYIDDSGAFTEEDKEELLKLASE